MRFELYAEFEFRIYLLPDFRFMYIHVNRKLTFKKGYIFLVICEFFYIVLLVIIFLKQLKQIKPRKTMSRFVVTNGEFFKGKGWELGLFLLFRKNGSKTRLIL